MPSPTTNTVPLIQEVLMEGIALLTLAAHILGWMSASLAVCVSFPALTILVLARLHPDRNKPEGTTSGGTTDD